MMNRPVFRFAPSPNGRLHLGHAYSALLNHRLADRAGGVLRLRMEDIDPARCTPEHEAAVAEDLAWLGVNWSGPVLRQSVRFSLYAAVLDGFAARHLVYPCFCTRGDVARRTAAVAGWPRDPDGSPRYPGTCRDLAIGERRRCLEAGVPFCLRLDLARALDGLTEPLVWAECREGPDVAVERADPAAWGDAVVRRRDVPTSYHLAVVVDDADGGVTDVVRGEDLFAATGLHRLLQVLLGLPAPTYHHHALVRDPDGCKLSKSLDSPSLADLRRGGMTAAQVRHRLGFS